MQFKNRQNWCIEHDDKVYWISRSVTVLPVVLFVLSGDERQRIFVPLGKRGKDLPDEVGKWGLPGGYLDWDETATEAVIRETYEELGLNLLEIRDRCDKFHGSFDHPYLVKSLPRGKQNVTLLFALMFWVDSLPELSPQVSSGEVEEVKWVDLATALQTDLAFQHHIVIRDCLQEQLAIDFDGF
ncbi:MULTISPECIES: NUDIX domain-containing protein [Planktothricoides]|uniref:NUDIX hydrolase n=2 Tax=Planktothricoides raciborskii TaxID=132608 RepID=A0AAU8J817_9CYAN|nr:MULTISPECIES: NUDIX hydrolase [Planktothricoides]KOR35019.1 DNA mismatch repair protein MutT [Planktothricoides sp. SR001]MBD2546797.1 NUDIX hydrolase [Planktothricoides raciborskii FACHB-1370]MBD2583086.1 NUDIX hydrolase [Planktothricoides raciborskii FACHB-1261]